MGYFALLEKIQIVLIQRIYIDGFDIIDEPKLSGGKFKVSIWHLDRMPINAFGSNKFRKYGKCCLTWTMNHKIGKRCDAMTHSLLLILTHMYSLIICGLV